ncbi:MULTISPECIES: hypothetical protein [Lactobacillus]|uniref:Uncharacterized protein n=1 Tax=Lactobacillus johnsonii TaxID=33959 RepID=A0A9X4XAV1_LACJH|nr:MULTISPECIES: hypothetical protein [Lactobacillus]MTE03595.1 hypothetical protein [Lactobacillus johnsonii]
MIQNDTYARIQLAAIQLFFKVNEIKKTQQSFTFVDLKYASTDNPKVQNWIDDTYARGGRFVVRVNNRNKTYFGSINFDFTFSRDLIDKIADESIRQNVSKFSRIILDKVYKNIKFLPNDVLIDDNIDFSSEAYVTSFNQAENIYEKNYKRDNPVPLDELDVARAQSNAKLLMVVGLNKKAAVYKKAEKLIEIFPKSLYAYRWSRSLDKIGVDVIGNIIKNAEVLKELGASNAAYLDELIEISYDHLRRLDKAEKQDKKLKEIQFATLPYKSFKVGTVVVINHERAYKVTRCKRIYISSSDTQDALDISNEIYSEGTHYMYYGHDITKSPEGIQAIAREHARSFTIFNLSEKDKAKKLIEEKPISLLKMANVTQIPYATLRTYVVNPEKLSTTAWIRVHTLSNLFNYLVNQIKKDGNLKVKKEDLVDEENKKTELHKAQSLILKKEIPFTKLSEKSGIPYRTLRNYVGDPEKMKDAAWIRIHRLAEVFNKLEVNE